MEFKIRYINSYKINEIDTRRICVDCKSFTYYDFKCYLKNLINLKETDEICIKLKKDNKILITESDWIDLVSSNSENRIIKLSVYFGNVHMNVECDYCREFIVGDRFKCLECDDYDICQMCFHSVPRIHSEHCIILLRKPEDRNKFIKSIPYRMENGSDFRVVDIDIGALIGSHQASEKLDNSSQTDSRISPPLVDAPDKSQSISHSIDKDKSSFEILDAEMPMKSGERQNCEKHKMNARKLNDVLQDQNCAPVSKEYLESLPAEILESVEKLKSMGFTNINGTLIALLVAHNGNVFRVLEELDYSTKHN